ncbi:lipopolysaccharide biosynthesis protein [Curtobacterium sp. RRHDQ10]|uniref:lipopolysaccharide biosynthesis protein n=1 Tax=Curtobacterium phyllosphaerae TaxID=3413379 RepID=UPI003BEF87A0
MAGQIVSMAGASAIAQILIAVLYLVAARVSSPAQYGVVVAAIALGQSGAGFFNFGTNELWVRDLARGKLDRQTFSCRLSSKLILAFLAALSWAFVQYLIAPSMEWWWVGPGIAFSTIFTQSLQVPLRAAARGHISAFSQIVDKAISGLIMGGGLALHAEVLPSLAISLIVGPLVGGCVAYLMTERGDRPGFVFRRLRFPWRGAKHYGAISIASGGQALDLPLLTIVAGAPAAGLYGAVNRWTQPMGLLASAFSSASVPFMARARSRREALRLAMKASWLLALAAGVCLIVAVLSPFFVETLLGGRYAGAAATLSLLAVGTIPAIANQPLSSFLQARGHDRYVGIVTLSSVAIQLVLVAVISGSFGAVGAGWAYLALQLLNLLLLVGGLVWTRDSESAEVGHEQIADEAQHFAAPLRGDQS